MNKKRLHMIEHAYGTHSKQPGYRDRYCTHISDDKDMNWLVKNGFFHGPHGDGLFGDNYGMYFLTEKGKRWANIPRCHFKEMKQAFADTGNGESVVFWECEVCGHTKECYRETGSI